MYIQCFLLLLLAIVSLALPTCVRTLGSVKCILNNETDIVNLADRLGTVGVGDTVDIVGNGNKLTGSSQLVLNGSAVNLESIVFNVGILTRVRSLSIIKCHLSPPNGTAAVAWGPLGGECDTGGCDASSITIKNSNFTLASGGALLDVRTGGLCPSKGGCTAVLDVQVMGVRAPAHFETANSVVSVNNSGLCGASLSKCTPTILISVELMVETAVIRRSLVFIHNGGLCNSSDCRPTVRVSNSSITARQVDVDQCHSPVIGYLGVDNRGICANPASPCGGSVTLSGITGIGSIDIKGDQVINSTHGVIVVSNTYACGVDSTSCSVNIMMESINVTLVNFREVVSMGLESSVIAAVALNNINICGDHQKSCVATASMNAVNVSISMSEIRIETVRTMRIVDFVVLGSVGVAWYKACGSTNHVGCATQGVLSRVMVHQRNMTLTMEIDRLDFSAVGLVVTGSAAVCGYFPIAVFDVIDCSARTVTKHIYAESESFVVMCSYVRASAIGAVVTNNVLACGFNREGTSLSTVNIKGCIAGGSLENIRVYGTAMAVKASEIKDSLYGAIGSNNIGGCGMVYNIDQRSLQNDIYVSVDGCRVIGWIAHGDVQKCNLSLESPSTVNSAVGMIAASNSVLCGAAILVLQSTTAVCYSMSSLFTGCQCNVSINDATVKNSNMRVFSNAIAESAVGMVASCAYTPGGLLSANGYSSQLLDPRVNVSYSSKIIDGSVEATITDVLVVNSYVNIQGKTSISSSLAIVGVNAIFTGGKAEGVVQLSSVSFSIEPVNISVTLANATSRVMLSKIKLDGVLFEIKSEKTWVCGVGLVVLFGQSACGSHTEGILTTGTITRNYRVEGCRVDLSVTDVKVLGRAIFNIGVLSGASVSGAIVSSRSRGCGWVPDAQVDDCSIWGVMRDIEFKEPEWESPPDVGAWPIQRVEDESSLGYLISQNTAICGIASSRCRAEFQLSNVSISVVGQLHKISDVIKNSFVGFVGLISRFACGSTKSTACRAVGGIRDVWVNRPTNGFCALFISNIANSTTMYVGIVNEGFCGISQSKNCIATSDISNVYLNASVFYLVFGTVNNAFIVGVVNNKLCGTDAVGCTGAVGVRRVTIRATNKLIIAASQVTNILAGIGVVAIHACGYNSTACSLSFNVTDVTVASAHARVSTSYNLGSVQGVVGLYFSSGARESVVAAIEGVNIEISQLELISNVLASGSFGCVVSALHTGDSSRDKLIVANVSVISMRAAVDQLQDGSFGGIHFVGIGAITNKYPPGRILFSHFEIRNITIMNVSVVGRIAGSAHPILLFCGISMNKLCHGFDFCSPTLIMRDIQVLHSFLNVNFAGCKEVHVSAVAMSLVAMCADDNPDYSKCLPTVMMEDISVNNSQIMAVSTSEGLQGLVSMSAAVCLSNLTENCKIDVLIRRVRLSTITMHRGTCGVCVWVGLKSYYSPRSAFQSSTNVNIEGVVDGALSAPDGEGYGVCIDTQYLGDVVKNGSFTVTVQLNLDGANGELGSLVYLWGNNTFNETANCTLYQQVLLSGTSELRGPLVLARGSMFTRESVTATSSIIVFVRGMSIEPTASVPHCGLVCLAYPTASERSLGTKHVASIIFERINHSTSQDIPFLDLEGGIDVHVELQVISARVTRGSLVAARLRGSEVVVEVEDCIFTGSATVVLLQGDLSRIRMRALDIRFGNISRMVLGIESNTTTLASTSKVSLQNIEIRNSNCYPSCISIKGEYPVILSGFVYDSNSNNQSGFLLLNNSNSVQLSDAFIGNSTARRGVIGLLVNSSLIITQMNARNLYATYYVCAQRDIAPTVPTWECAAYSPTQCKRIFSTNRSIHEGWAFANDTCQLFKIFPEILLNAIPVLAAERCSFTGAGLRWALSHEPKLKYMREGCSAAGGAFVLEGNSFLRVTDSTIDGAFAHCGGLIAFSLDLSAGPNRAVLSNVTASSWASLGVILFGTGRDSVTMERGTTLGVAEAGSLWPPVAQGCYFVGGSTDIIAARRVAEQWPNCSLEPVVSVPNSFIVNASRTEFLINVSLSFGYRFLDTFGNSLVRADQSLWQILVLPSCEQGDISPYSSSPQTVASFQTSNLNNYGRDDMGIRLAFTSVREEVLNGNLTFKDDEFQYTTVLTLRKRCDFDFQYHEASGECQACQDSDSMYSLGVRCYPCPEGCICTGRTVSPEDAYWMYRNETHITCYQCPVKELCLADGCAGNHDGLLCGSCKPGFTVDIFECRDCKAYGFLQIALRVLAAVGMAAAFALFTFVTVLPSDTSATKQFSQLVQLLSLLQPTSPKVDDNFTAKVRDYITTLTSIITPLGPKTHCWKLSEEAKQFIPLGQGLLTLFALFALSPILRAITNSRNKRAFIDEYELDNETSDEESDLTDNTYTVTDETESVNNNSVSGEPELPQRESLGFDILLKNTMLSILLSTFFSHTVSFLRMSTCTQPINGVRVMVFRPSIVCNGSYTYYLAGLGIASAVLFGVLIYILWGAYRLLDDWYTAVYRWPILFYNSNRSIHKPVDDGTGGRFFKFRHLARVLRTWWIVIGSTRQLFCYLAVIISTRLDSENSTKWPFVTFILAMFQFALLLKPWRKFEDCAVEFVVYFILLLVAVGNYYGESYPIVSTASLLGLVASVLLQFGYVVYRTLPKLRSLAMRLRGAPVPKPIEAGSVRQYNEDVTADSRDEYPLLSARGTDIRLST